MKITKRLLAIVMALVTLASVVSISAEAIEIVVEDDENYGYMVPVNHDGTKVLSTVKVYGEYDYISFFVNVKQNFFNFFVYEIYSDKGLTNCVESGYVEYDYRGTYEYDLKLKLKGKYKTKTYYVATYAMRFYDDPDHMVVDASSMCVFKLKVDRSPTYEQSRVVINNVKNTAEGAGINWTKISGSSKYYIYRKAEGSTKMTKIGAVSGKKSSFVDTAKKRRDGIYSYTVKGVNKKGETTRYLYNGVTCLYVETPVINFAGVTENNTIKLEWNKTDADAKYYIYRKEAGGEWERVEDYYANYYVDTDVENGKEYSYRVKSIIDYDDYGKGKSAYSIETESIKFLSAPVMNDLEIKECSIGLSWNSVEGATGYSILRKPLDTDDEWTVLATVSGEETYYEDATASLTDSAYHYTVRSEGEGFSGSYSSGKAYFTLTEPEFTTFVDTDGVRIEWPAVPYATSYRVYEQNEDGTWGIKHKTSKLYYEFNPRTYYNKKLSVCACRSDGGVGTYKTDVESTEYFPEIKHTVKELDTYTQFDWDGTGADVYRIYRKPKGAENSAYELFYESADTGFSNYNPEEDVAYTYQIRGVYGDIEQDENLYTKTHIRYAPETCINSFNAYKEVCVTNREYKSNDKEKKVYRLDVEKTEKYKKSAVNFYYWGKGCGGEGWGSTNGYSYTPYYEDAYDLIEPARFCCVVSTSSGNSTPLGVNVITIPEEVCEAPEVTLTPTSKGLKMTWNAVDDAVEYDVAVYFSRRDDYRKTFKADGSETYTINFTDISYDYNMYLSITAVHKNGNKTVRRIDDYAFYPKPKLVAAVPDNFSDGIDFFWSTGGIDGCFAVLRKAEGESKWTCVSKKYYDGTVCSMNNGVEYRGFVYTDKNVKKGVKYTYTVRRYDSKTKEYISYYDTKGVSTEL